MDFVFIYLDDILIANVDDTTHLLHFRSVQEFGLVINLSKCQFGLSEVESLGNRIYGTGAEPLIQNVAAIQEFSQPSDFPQLQQFLGMMNFTKKKKKIG